MYWKSCARVAASILSLAAISYPAIAQVQPTDTNLDTGIKPNEVYDRGREIVNVGSGNLNIQIPLVHLPGRNGHDLDLSLTYNSQNWTPIPSLVNPGNGTTPPDYNAANIEWNYSQTNSYGVGSTGWQLNIPALYATVVTTPPPICANGPTCGGDSYSQDSVINGFVLVMGDGTKYQFQTASMDHLTFVTSCAGGTGSCNYSTTVPGDDVLIDYDYAQYPHTPNPGSGQGVMLDLTNAAGGNGTAIVRFRDGSQILFPINGWGYSPIGQPPGQNIPAAGPVGATASAMTDSNGNVISISSNGSGTVITDTLGRTVTVGVNNGSIQYKDSNGQSRTVTLNYSQFPNSSSALPTFTTPAAGTNGIVSVGAEPISFMLSSVVLPDGLSYTFQYNEFGEIIEITYPSGGYTRYGYQDLPNFYNYTWTPALGGYADSRQVVDKYECPAVAVGAGATTPSGYVGSSAPKTCPVAENHTQYIRTGTFGSPVTVNDAKGNKTDYTFAGNLEASRRVYQGASTLLRTASSTYVGNLKNSETVTLPNGLTSETVWTYDTAPNQYFVTVNDMNMSEQLYAFAETDNLIDKKEYGFGQGAPGSLLQETVSQYVSTNSANAANYQQSPIYILDRKQSEEVKDGNGNRLAVTAYEYDNYRGGIVASGVVQHGTSSNPYDTTYKTRGNITAVRRQVLNANGSVVLTTINDQFDDAGNVLVRLDAAGKSTTLQYGNPGGDSTCATQQGNGAAYVTQVTDPMGLQTNYTWNSCTGTLASVTDTNRQQTTFAYDLMDRRIQAVYPDAAQTCVQYSDALNTTCGSIPAMAGSIASQSLIKVAETKTGRSTTPTTTATALDGLSRPVESEIVLATPILTDTTYDAVGNVASITNSYNAGDQNYGVTYFQYDALGRKVFQQQQDSNYLQWCYDGTKSNSAQTNCAGNLGNQNLLGSTVDSSDETGRHWQRTSDAMGNLIKVLEPGPGTALQPLINNASVNPANETDYTYDAVGNLKQVDQWNGSYGTGPDVMRSFSYDTLSRLTLSTNPETGTTSYSYRTSSGLCSADSSAVCLKTDANGTTTTYSYDLDARLIGKTYSDGTAPATYVYQYGSGSSGNNANGRLIQEYTGSAQSPLTSRSIAQYDQLGRTQQEVQCVLGSCTAPSALSYTYDGMGNVSSASNGLFTVGYTYDQASRLSQVTSSWSDAQHPDTLFLANSANSYGPLGLISAQLGYSSASGAAAISLTRGYDIRARVNAETDQGIAFHSTSGQVTITVNGAEQGTGNLSSANGSVTINGSEQSKQTYNGPGSQQSIGTLTIGGSEQSKSSPGGVGSQKSTGWVTISGTEQSAVPCNYCPTQYDDGVIFVVINGHTETVSYGQNDDIYTLSSALATAINRDSSASGVTATDMSGSVTLTSVNTGAGTNYSLLAYVNGPSDTSLFSGASFSASVSGANMTGGQDGTIYDNGSVTVSINGHPNTATYGQGSSNASVAASLVNAINSDGGASVTASANGTTVTLQSKQPGAGTNWPVSTIVNYDTGDFGSTSYTMSSSGMTGGQDGTVYDSGSVTITVNGHADSTSYGNGSTASGMASALASAINGDGGAPVIASVSGSTLNLTTKQAGLNVNYSLSASNSFDSGDFSQSSFTASLSGGTLTGGDATVFDSGSVTLTINGTSETVPYGQGDTAASIAAKLQNAFSGNGSVTVSASDASLTIVSTTQGASTNYAFSSSNTYNNGSFSSPSFNISPSSGSLTGGADAAIEPVTLYSYSIPSNGYDLNGNVVQATDQITGTWSYTYDSLNRLQTASASVGSYTGLNVGWIYDNFGNRTGQSFSGTSSVGLTQPSTPAYTGNGAGNNNRADQFVYDNAGRVLADWNNGYMYDAEGRLCALNRPGVGVTVYLYNADGYRVAKGSGSFSCNMGSNGFTLTNSYLLDLGGNQVSESDGASNWVHSNVFANGKLLTTYSATGTPLTFALNDWLGTRRVQAKADGEFEASFLSLPFGDQLPSGTGATEHFFTGKERDTESGLDYFGARYYGSTMGRMMSPDPHSGTLLHIFNPQRWNMYSYALNNPLTFVDPTGMDAVAVNFSGMVGGLGHEGILAISSDGSATYSRFGPSEQTIGGGYGLSEPGQADVTNLNVKVQFGSDGLPTADSYKAIEGAVAGIEKAPASTVRLNYFKTSDGETAALKEWMKQQHDNAGKYKLCTRNCANFTVQGLLASHALNQSQASTLSNHPNTLFLQLVPLANDSSPHYKATSRIVPDSVKKREDQ